MSPVTFAGQTNAHSIHFADELPKNVAMTLNQGSAVRRMDFHPVQQTLLLVGKNVGDIAVWELRSGRKLAHKKFKVWDVGTCSSLPLAALFKEPAISVNRVAWSPYGFLFGVAYNKHVVQVYSHHSGDDIRHHLEIDAHIGSVNDLAFSYPKKQLFIVTCGDDKAVKVWDAISGSKQYHFEGHEAPVFSVCPHNKEIIQLIFSSVMDGKIKAWLYDGFGSRVDIDAPGHCCTTMTYSADGTRLFSCGTSKVGLSYLVEWNEREGGVNQTYQGFRKRSTGVVQFETTKNRFLAVGDEFVIKIWDMDYSNLLQTIEADGGLPASPRTRFNKDGIMLAVSTIDNGIKILATDGLRLLCSYEAPRSASVSVPKPSTSSALGAASVNAGSSVGPADRDGPVTSIITMNGDSQSLTDVKPRILNESMEKPKIWKLTEINEPSQCRSQRLPDNLLPIRVSRLIYTNSGLAILALASDAVHKLWKWSRSARNSTAKASSVVPPQLWQPCSGILMTNEINETNPEDAVPCFALSNNDCYVVSASGGKISLFNMMTFKTMTAFMPSPPAATFLAFYPQDNNIIAIGMDDSSIQIYHVRVDEVKIKLKGHQKRVTGLAFSNILNVLVSSGADAQLCVWSTDGWEKQATKFLQIPNGRVPAPLAEMRVQFHQDQTQFLTVHETQIAIYEAPKLKCLKQWVPQEPSVPITHATYSCDSQSIYASFGDGSVGVLSATTLRLRCRISPTAYIPSSFSLNNSRVYPLGIAAHPFEPNQFALGLTDGGVHVLEPLESKGKWGTMPPSENGAGSSIAPGQGSSDQQGEPIA